MMATSQAMKFQFPAIDVTIDVESGYDFMSPEYCAFFNTQRATAFQGPRWMAAIHRQLVPRLNAEQHTIVVRAKRDGALMAVLPFVIQKTAMVSIIQPADFGVCDSNAIVADRETLENLADNPAALDCIDALTRGAGALMFRKVRRDSFDIRRIFRGATASPCENAAYHSNTGTDFEVWQRKTINRKFSKELGRLNRQIARDIGPYEHRLVVSETEIRDAFSFLRKAREGRFDGDLLDNEIYAKFYLDFAIEGAATGDALTYASYLNGEPVAVLVGVGSGDECHAVLIASDTERLSRYSVGIQLLYRIIKLRFDEGKYRFDFGLGNTGYKSMFKVEETLLDNITVSKSLAGSAMTFVYHRSKPLKNTLRKFIPHLR